MADVLKQQYDLLALKISMDLTADEPQVRFELRGRSQGQTAPVHGWLCAAEEIGLPRRLDRGASVYRGYRFTFPKRVLDELKDVLAAGGYGESPLWLHMARPLGYLNLVPWEQLLVPALGVPLLRLPDFLAKPPRESLNSLDVLLCTSLPVAKESFLAVEHLVRIAEHILGLGPPQTTVHVFADAQLYGEVAYRMGALPRVHVYDPAEAGALPGAAARADVSDQAGRIANPWLVWMRNALQGRSIDVAHFLVHGYLSRDQGALALAESPLENADRRIARFVGAAELLTFLTRIGAWAAAFGSPENNYSEMGLRLLADTIAQIRPGPVLHHELRLDQDCAAMAEAYRFLFGRGQVRPPVSPALFTYCHPSRLEVQAEAGVPSEPRRIRAWGESGDVVTSLYESDTNVPAWIAATERYVEQRRLAVERMSREGEEADTAARGRETRGKDAVLIEDTLRQIQDVLERVAAEMVMQDRHG